jgi:hypothetical protein
MTPKSFSKVCTLAALCTAARAFLPAAAIITPVGCQPEFPEQEQQVTATDADGIDTEAVADESGGPTIDGCIYAPSPNAVGYKYECNVQYDVAVRATVDPLIGANFEISEAANNVSSVNEGSYEHPIVMACCSEVDPLPADTCTLPAHKACFSDLVSQACQQAAAMLEDLHHELAPGSGFTAVDQAADELRLRVNDCYEHFWELDVAVQAQPDACGVAHTSFYHHPVWNAGFSVTAAGVTVSDIEVDLTSLLGATTVQPLPQEPDLCSDPGENDGDFPPWNAPGSSGGFLSSIGTTSVNATGPQWLGEVMSGSGAFAAGSAMHRWFDGTKLKVDELVMIEDAPITAGTSSLQASVDGFVLKLTAPVTATKSGSRYTAAAGSARFVLQATIDGQGFYVQALNSSPMQFYTSAGGVGQCPSSVSQCLVSRAFSIGYVDAFGGVWDLDVAAATWKP